ncbi:cation transporter [Promicromonospora sp. NPDC090134]|uniref:cation transporter n=1 Tax=Promicromonospora sp. NPDC090134 TaxID=3364408 RepID=UPI0037F7A870
MTALPAPRPLPVPLSAARRAVLARRIRWVVAATITYNVIEAVVALTAGRIASSSALIGFGLDSVVEVLSAAAVAWQFAGRDPEAREKVALRLIAFSFFGLAAFVTVDAARALLGATSPEHSTVGIVLAAVSLLVMPGLSWFERRTGRELGSASAVADSRQTLICSYLSAALLAGLLLNSLLGWWWADPVAAVVIAGFAVREGWEAWHGDPCCTPVAQLVGDGELQGDPRAEQGCGDDGCRCAD